MRAKPSLISFSSLCCLSRSKFYLLTRLMQYLESERILRRSFAQICPPSRLTDQLLGTHTKSDRRRRASLLWHKWLQLLLLWWNWWHRRRQEILISKLLIGEDTGCLWLQCRRQECIDTRLLGLQRGRGKGVLSEAGGLWLEWWSWWVCKG